MIGGLTTHYPDTIRPALQVLSVRPGFRKVAGLYVLIMPKGQIYFLADTTVTIDPTAEELAETAILAAEKVRMLDIEPRVAMLSFSNFGSNHHPQSEKMRRAVELALETGPPGKVSVEHVVNVLGRLNAAPAPPTVADTVRVATQ